MPKGVYKKTKEHKRKISEANKGKKLSIETRKKMSNSKKGKVSSRKGVVLSDDIKERMSKAAKGRKSSEKTKRKLSKLKKGKNNPMWGKTGEQCPSWKGGISKKYPQDWTDDLRDSIRKRDDYTCQECGIHQNELDRKLDVHHIDYNKNNINPYNLITLCKNCHMKTNYNRDYWIEYFNNIKN